LADSQQRKSVEVLRVLERQHATGLRLPAFALLLIVAVLGFAPGALAASGANRYAKLDDELNRLATSSASSQTTTVILHVKGNTLPAGLKKYARPGSLDFINAYVLDVPNNKLKSVNDDPGTDFASAERTAHAANFRTGVQSGAFFARRLLGYTGAGVGVAVIDSGIAPNEEFTTWEGQGRRPGRSRVTYFQDFLVPDKNHVGLEIACATPCDPNGHGTHVSGTIAGNGFDSFGEKSGMAPDASLVSLRVLGKDGSGSLTGVLNALQWVLQNARRYNIRVVNLSLGIAPTGAIGNGDPKSVAELLHADPLARATKKLVDAGILVVGAAGNIGQVDCRDASGNVILVNNQPTKCEAWGGTTAPGSYPWVLTVGADSSMGTFSRKDDTRAKFSSRGPAFPLQIAKPDILAGGVGIESTSAPGSTLYDAARVAGFLLPGSFPKATDSYMALSGTSQGSAVVSGVAALMLQANPRLTPNLIKAILEYTSQEYNKGVKGYSPLEQGAGFLNALGAVRLSRFYATARKGQRVPVEPIWSQHFIWGNHLLSGGIMLPTANAWQVGVEWGVAKTDEGENIVWGTSCGADDCGENIVWGTSDDENIVWGTEDDANIVWGTEVDDSGNIVWGTDFGDENIVWGTDCGGADCENIVWGTAREDDGDGNIVWGTADGDENIVWGTDEDGNIVWGTDDGDGNIVWGTADDENIVWGTDDFDGNIVWGTDDFDLNIVWGTDDENIVWGTDGENIVWGTDDENIVWGTAGLSKPATQAEWYKLFLSRRFDVFWVSVEFGDRFVTRDGREVFSAHLRHAQRKSPARKHHK
jgi:subtilisin family serine protease